MTPDTPRAIEYYYQARDWVLASPYYFETFELAATDHRAIDETRLLREHAWVVLNSGFRESVVRQRFDYISLCFCDWESASAVVSDGELCVRTALKVFGNEPKLNAILNAARLIDDVGFGSFLAGVRQRPDEALRRLPYIGEVTCLHLAKNLGFNFAKPDRHLVRLAGQFGYQHVAEMCATLASATGDEESIIDLVLWRFQERAFSRSHGSDAGASRMRRHKGSLSSGEIPSP